MFQKVLIANRGEIALRLIKVLNSMGVGTVAVYSDADAGLPFVAEANEAVRIGPPAAKDSYLSFDALLDAAKTTGAQAIHPGYGFLSENVDFAEACRQHQLVFIGPEVESMRRMKDKSQARRLVSAAGVQVVPGSYGVVADIGAAHQQAEKIGFPILCKAAGGGGGIGMAVARSSDELDKVFRQCADRARSAFGREGIYLERYFEAPRHIEVQILGDRFGHLIHGLERECSIQRRHQKVVEEAPSPLFSNPPGLEPTDSLRAALFESALIAARSFGYSNAGTVEFLYAEGAFYFIEMNARLQVEHPITELTTGIDLIGWQLKLAAGEALTVSQDSVIRQGVAIEFRIYAEDSVNFFPSPGTLTRYREPTGPGIRVDAGYQEGAVVTPFYDPLIAKLIVSGSSREQVIHRARTAVREFRVEGIKTNLPLHQRILDSEKFCRGELSTRFIEEMGKA